MACYHGDEASQLRDSIDSVTSDQTRRPDEVVLVVDGPVSEALDAEIIAAYRDAPVPIVVHRLPRNGGLGPALNAGLALCRHEIVARQDADDPSLPERFERQVPLVEAGFDVVGSALREFHTSPADPSGDGVVRVPPLTEAAIERGARFHQPVFHPTVVVRRAAVQAVGGYEDLPSLEDYWLFGRLLAAGARFANVAEPLVAYRIGAGAYARRGGLELLRSELELQRRFHRLGFTTAPQYARNVVVRGGYRLVPEGLRRTAYRALIARRDRP
jgi:glycosyltransferase involved in cell wall biosynthesis